MLNSVLCLSLIDNNESIINNEFKLIDIKESGI